MKYQKLTDKIIQSLRKDVNQNILTSLSNNPIQPEQVYNFFTGKGGLHGLDYADFSNYYSYSSQKKELELGQFFTDHDSAKFLCELISPNGSVLDPCAGHGVFCNFVEESHFHGCELDMDNVQVANYLWPSANITKYDVRYYNPSEKMDYIITNPPFNFRWQTGEYGTIWSQSFILRQAKHWLKPYGIFAAIVPNSFLMDEMTYKQDIEYINQNYTWLGQVQLPSNAFSQYEIDIQTKIIVFQNISSTPSFSPDFSTDLKQKIDNAKKVKRQNSLKILNSTDEQDEFSYKVKKLLYEVKRQKETVKKYDSAIALVNKYHTQQKPANMDYDVWEAKHKLKVGTVLYHLKNYARSSPAKKRGVRTPAVLDPIQTKSFKEIPQCPHITKFLTDFRFMTVSGKGKFDGIQKNDLNLITQKPHAILNWEQGIGKTIGGYAVSKFRNRHTIIIAPSLAIKETWIPFLKLNKEKHIVVKKITDFDPYNEDAQTFYLFSMSTLSRDKILSKRIKKILRQVSNNVQCIMDESDEISNNNSKVSKHVRLAFTKCRYKLLMTGTTIRNNAAELFPQLQFLYNNSKNFLDKCETIHIENKKKNTLDKLLNDNIGNPLDTVTKFKRCFSPGKCTVFGIEKQEQTVYNYDQLLEILNYTQITRTFREVCGNKYKINHVLLQPTAHERELQDKILDEFQTMVHHYFEQYDNAKKESALKLIRQIQLLIKSCSVPQLFAEYKGISSTKAAKIKEIISERDELIMIGITTKDAARLYQSMLSVIGRPIFYIDGEVPIPKRGKILKDFQLSGNGILISTQQSLKSSVNIPACNLVIIESLQWNLAKVSQYFFRSIRYDSEQSTEVMFLTYSPSIEDNIMNLLLNKEKIAKALKFDNRDNDEVLEELGFDGNILLHLLERKKDKETGNYILKFQN